MSLLRPEVLARLSTLELVARSAVEGYFQGMHRSPRFGFSQEFAEYKAYAEGDDPRFVDWNVYARTDRTYIRRYHRRDQHAADDRAGCQRLDGLSRPRARSASCATRSSWPLRWRTWPCSSTTRWGSSPSIRRSAAIGRASSRSGSLTGILHALDALQPGSETDLSESLRQLREHCQRRGLVAVISDLYCDPEALTRAVQPLAWRGHDIMILQVLDRAELEPAWQESVLLEDVESGRELEVSPDYLRTTYRERIDGASGAGEAGGGRCRRGSRAAGHRRAAGPGAASLPAVPPEEQVAMGSK